MQRLFLAITANEDLKIYGSDAKDTYAHSPAPDVPTFVTIDDQYADWYKHTFNKKINRSLVLPVQRALQGHPESGHLWEKYVNQILFSDELRLQMTTHDRTTYTTTFKGERYCCATSIIRSGERPIRRHICPGTEVECLDPS